MRVVSVLSVIMVGLVVKVFHKIVCMCSVFSVVIVITIVTVSMLSVENQNYYCGKEAFIITAS